MLVFTLDDLLRMSLWLCVRSRLSRRLYFNGFLDDKPGIIIWCIFVVKMLFFMCESYLKIDNSLYTFFDVVSSTKQLGTYLTAYVFPVSRCWTLHTWP